MALRHRLEAGDYRDIVRRALAEDIAGGDITTNAIFGPDDRARGTFVAKSPCTLAGVEVAVEVLSQLDAGVEAALHFRDGDECAAGAAVGRVTGSARALLSGERTALNFLQHLSGIATLAREFVRASERSDYDSRYAENDADAASAREVRSADGRCAPTIGCRSTTA